MTLPELAQAVAEELGTLGAGQGLSAEDEKLVTDRYYRVRRLYEHRGYMHWSDSDNIPNGAETGVTALVAYYCAKPFGVPRDPQLKADGERDLALYRDRQYPRRPVKFKSF